MYSNGRMNYYVPIKEDEAPPCKKICESIPQARYAVPKVRILGRKYALTATSNKYLEIGISVGHVSTVEIALGDNRGNQLMIHMETWRELMERQDDIQRLLQADKPFSQLWIRGLGVELRNINGLKLVKITSSFNCLFMKPATFNILFTFENCIDHMYAWLSENTHLVNLKFKNFVNVLRETDITTSCHATKAIRESKDFDCESLIDCEILACALTDIRYEACEIKCV